MTQNPSLEDAFNRLDKALTMLEGTFERRMENQGDVAEIEEEVQRLNADRAKLAQELDQSEARAERLEQSNREVSKRLINAMETIRSVVDQ